MRSIEQNKSGTEVEDILLELFKISVAAVAVAGLLNPVALPGVAESLSGLATFACSFV